MSSRYCPFDVLLMSDFDSDFPGIPYRYCSLIFDYTRDLILFIGTLNPFNKSTQSSMYFGPIFSQNSIGKCLNCPLSSGSLPNTQCSISQRLLSRWTSHRKLVITDFLGNDLTRLYVKSMVITKFANGLPSQSYHIK